MTHQEEISALIEAIAYEKFAIQVYIDGALSHAFKTNNDIANITCPETSFRIPFCAEPAHIGEAISVGMNHYAEFKRSISYTVVRLRYDIANESLYW